MVLIPQLRSAPRLKITDIRILDLKVVRETGKMEAAWNPGTVTTHRVGGGSVIEIRTDQGLSGIAPAIDGSLDPAKARLVGVDPFAIEQLAGPLRYYPGQSPRTVSSLEIALWDLIGKAARPAALQTLGGREGPRSGLCQHDPAFYGLGPDHGTLPRLHPADFRR